MQIKIIVSDHTDSKQLAIIEVHALNILGLWKMIESYGVFRDVLSIKVEDLIEYYREEPNVTVDDENLVLYPDSSEVYGDLGSPKQAVDKLRVIDGPLLGEDLLENSVVVVATHPSVLSVVRENDGNKPSPSSEISKDVERSSMQCQPYRVGGDLKRHCATHLTEDCFSKGFEKPHIECQFDDGPSILDIWCRTHQSSCYPEEIHNGQCPAHPAALLCVLKKPLEKMGDYIQCQTHQRSCSRGTWDENGGHCGGFGSDAA